MRILNFINWLNEQNTVDGPYYKSQLNPSFWSKKDDGSFEFDSKVKEKLLQIANEFYSSYKLDVPIYDIQLTGSLANYNWTEKSDLDVHVLIDFSMVDDNVDLVKKAMDGQRFLWNIRHNIVIRQHDVEVYLQDKNEPHVASGLYSLLRGEWIRVPNFSPPEIDDMDVEKKFQGLASDIDQIEVRINAEPDGDIGARELYEFAESIKKKIMTMRKEGLAEKGEFAVENLVFKKLRNEGYIEKIIDLISKAYEKIYNE